jgi:hypothetical protein
METDSHYDDCDGGLDCKCADRDAGRDGDALDRIQEMLRDPQWGVGMLEDIAEIVTGTGRTTKNYPDERPTWGRH